MSLGKLTLELALEVSSCANVLFSFESTIPSSLADQTTSRIVAELGKNVNVMSLRRRSPLTCGVMCFVSSSLFVFYIIFLILLADDKVFET